MRTRRFVIGVCLLSLFAMGSPDGAQARGRALPRPAARRVPARAVARPALHRRPANPVARVSRPKRVPPRVVVSPRVPVRPNVVVRPRLVVPRVIRVARVHGPRPAATAIASARGQVDLAVVDIRVDNSGSAGSIENAAKVTATIENVGQSDYRSEEGWQVFVLYKDGDLVAQCRFEDLPVGEELSLSVDNQHGPAVYEGRVVYAEDIRQDGNPLNDDANPQNDQLSRNLNPA